MDISKGVEKKAKIFTKEQTESFESLWEVKILNKQIVIKPTQDVFVSYMFNDPANAETLKLMLNIFARNYLAACQNKETCMREISGEINVTTQWAQFVNPDDKNATLVQDIKVEENDGEFLTFVEFQNQTHLKKPIELRGLEYFGLSLGYDIRPVGEKKKSTVSQQWIMSENQLNLTQGLPMECYRLVGEQSAKFYPSKSHLTFVCLPLLAKEKNEAGDLAKFLLGEIFDSNYEPVKKIIAGYKSTFTKYKQDKEAIKMYTVWDKVREDAEAMGEAKGEARGEAKGEARGKAITRAILKGMKEPISIAKETGYPVEEVVKFLNMEQMENA